VTDQNQTPADEDLDDDIDPQVSVDEATDLPEDTEAEGPLSDHERGLLSEEELAALEGDDGNEDGDDGVQPAPADALAAETPAPAPAQPAAPQPEQAPAAQPVATDLTDEAIDAAEAGLQAAKDGRKAILDQYDDGELTAAERDAKMGELDDQIAQHAATLRVAEDAFNATKASFAQTAKGYLEANSILLDDAHLQNFDKMVREVSVSPLAIGKTHEQILAAAHRRYKADAAAFGIDIPEPVLGAAASKPQAKPQTTLAPKAAPPRTLMAIPPAAVTGTSDGRYSSIQQEIDATDDPYVIEKLMSRMTEAEREAFASMDV
jgi:hypothetical protein